MAPAVGHEPRPPFVSAKEAARILRVHPNTLCKWRISGGGPPFIKVGTRIRYSISEISRWMRDHTYSHTGQYLKERRDHKTGSR